MASFVAENVTNMVSYPLALRPTSAFPLDARSMFGSKAAADAAALTAENAGSTNTVYYIGQILTVYENGVVSHYSIQEDKTLKEVGAAVMGDDQAIVVGSDGKISMKGFGTEYYKYVSKDVIVEGEFAYPDNMPADASVGSFVKVADVWYVLVAGEADATSWEVAEAEPKTEDSYELTQGWTTGLTPQVIVNDNSVYELAWFEPSKITVEGLSSGMAALQATVENMGANVTANTEAIRVLNGNADVEGSVDNKIANVMNNLTDDGKINTFKELVNWAENHNTEVANYGADIQANKEAIEDLQQNALTDASQFATADQGTLADTALQPEDIVAGSNGHLTVDGTDVKVYELNPAQYGVLGGMSPDGTTITTDASGVAKVGTIDSTHISDLNTKLEGAKNDAVTEAGNNAAETYVAKANITTSTAVSAGIEAASDEKVVSEKAWMDAMTWKESM